MQGTLYNVQFKTPYLTNSLEYFTIYTIKGTLPSSQITTTSVRMAFTKEWRMHFFNTQSLKVLFCESSPDSLVQFLKQTSLLDKL